MSGVASGRLRHKVRLQENRITQDPATGEMVSAWTTIAQPWADVVPMSAREFVAASAE
jgi:head-tail adaptor